MTLIIEPENAEKIKSWIETRQGVAVWKCCDLSSSRIGQETLTPATHENGEPATSPHWSNGNAPDRIITELSDVGVRSWKEVSRVKIRRGPPCYGHVHRADRDKLDTAIAKAGDGASWKPDYERAYGSPWFTAIIEIPSDVTPLV